MNKYGLPKDSITGNTVKMKAFQILALLIASVSSLLAQEVQQPFTERRYSLQDVFANRFDLDGKVVKIDVTFTKVAPEQVSKDEWKMFCKSSPGIASAYEYVYIGRDGAQKIFLGKSSAPRDYQGYALVTPDKITLIGKSVHKGTNGKVVEYTW